MNKAFIKLAYKQIVNIHSATVFERQVFNDSFMEFCMQAQVYNPENKLSTLQELINNNPKANSLHYKVGFAIGLYVKELNNLIPNVFDTFGDTPIPFSSYSFKILSSNLNDRSQHEVSFTYQTNLVLCFGSVGDCLLLATGNQVNDNQLAETFLLKMRPELSITHYQEVL
ncbi:hypothetical protein ACI6Q2_12715 [Chitinophagaceae bacterium LWZ2-11]